MPTRQDLQELTDFRLREAKLMFDNGFYDGAKYILGYCLETALKARICQILDIPYPEQSFLRSAYFTHKFDNLILLGGLKNQLDRKKFDDLAFGANWSLVTSWNEGLRYEKIGTATEPELAALFNALEDPDHGVLTWVKTLW